MKIINIKSKNKKYEIGFIDGTSLTISEETKVQFNLFKNKEIDEIAFSHIESENRINELYLLATRRLNYTNLSIAKMEEFLKKKGANKKEIKQIIDRLNSNSLISEDEIIKNVISYCDQKHYGFNRIIKMLNQKQISKNKIEKLNVDLSRENKEALLMLERLIKRYKGKEIVNLKQALYYALIRYGFDENIAISSISKRYSSSFE